MRVLLVSANREQIPDPVFPLGLAYIAAAARRQGHTVEVADLCFERRPLDEVRRHIDRFRPQATGVSLRNVDNAAYPRTVDYLELHRRLINTLHDCSDAPVILGGSAFSILPEAYMQTLGADWGVRGEGEQAFCRLLAALQAGRSASTVPGVLAPPGESIHVAPFVTPLNDSLNWGNGLRPARSLFSYARYIRRGGMGNVQTKRGCVFKCSYCTYPLLEGRRFRCREAADVVDDGQLQRLGKSFDAGAAERANRYCVEAGLKVCQTVIFGAPGETRQSIRTTCEALRRMKPTAVVAMTGVRLYPGTPLTQTLISQGRVNQNDIGLLPTFYIEPAVADFLPGYLRQHAVEAGNWVLPGLAEPILPRSQRLLRGLGVSGPLWRLLQRRWMQRLNRSRFHRTTTSWGIPNQRRKVV